MTRVEDRNRWLNGGASGSVHDPEPLEIPEFDNGPTVQALPVQIDASFHQASDWSWRCTSVTIVGIPTAVRTQTPVSYTWSDVEAALTALPEWATGFVERNLPPRR